MEQIVSPVEVSYREIKKKSYYQINQSVKSYERAQSRVQLDSTKYQSIKSISSAKTKILEKNGSRKETQNSSNMQASSAEPRYFCFNDFESSTNKQTTKSSVGGKTFSGQKLLFHQKKSSILSKKLCGSNHSKSPNNVESRNSLYVTKS
jgi:hypothetical protein